MYRTISNFDSLLLFQLVFIMFKSPMDFRRYPPIWCVFDTIKVMLVLMYLDFGGDILADHVDD